MYSITSAHLHPIVLVENFPHGFLEKENWRVEADGLSKKKKKRHAFFNFKTYVFEAIMKSENAQKWVHFAHF